MKEFKEVLEAIIKYGVIPLFMIMVIKLNNKMEEFEERWINCIEDKEQLLKNRIVSNKNQNTILYIKPVMIATLPNDNHTKRKKDEKDI